MRLSTSLIAVEQAIFSDSAVDNDISVCILLAHTMGQSAYNIAKPVLDKTLSALSASAFAQPPAKSAST